MLHLRYCPRVDSAACCIHFRSENPSPTLPKGKGELSLQAAHCVPERSFFKLIFREKETPFPLGKAGDGSSPQQKGAPSAPPIIP